MKTIQTVSGRQKSRSATAGGARFSEGKIWRSVRGDWRKLHGGIYDEGVSVEWHDFDAGKEFEWSGSFHPGSLELCLNLEGDGSVRDGKKSLRFAPMTAGFYLAGAGGLKASRSARQRHRFLSIEFSREFLREHLAQCDGALHPLVESFLRDRECSAAVSEVWRMTGVQQEAAVRMPSPPTAQAARGLWHRSQVLQWMADFFFERRDSEELFCDRQKRIARERVDRAITVLRENLCEPPSLEELGRKVGCSPYHLSRTFSGEMGMTLPQYMRKLRMERAGELLQAGKHNVTEAAMEVGYSSLSHFSQAFCQTMGCCPALYSAKPS